MLPLNNTHSKDQNDLFKGSIWKDFFSEQNLDMVPYHVQISLKFVFQKKVILNYDLLKVNMKRVFPG